MNWLRLRRLFQVDGNLGGLRYEARLRLFELDVSDITIAGNEIANAPQPQLSKADESAESIMTNRGTDE